MICTHSGSVRDRFWPGVKISEKLGKVHQVWQENETLFAETANQPVWLSHQASPAWAPSFKVDKLDEVTHWPARTAEDKTPPPEADANHPLPRRPQLFDWEDGILTEDAEVVVRISRVVLHHLKSNCYRLQMIPVTKQTVSLKYKRVSHVILWPQLCLPNFFTLWITLLFLWSWLELKFTDM